MLVVDTGVLVAATDRTDPHHTACAELLTGETGPLVTTDASLIALAERHREQRIATLNRRHFAVVRPAHVNAFTLLP